MYCYSQYYYEDFIRDAQMIFPITYVPCSDTYDLTVTLFKNDPKYRI